MCIVSTVERHKIFIFDHRLVKALLGSVTFGNVGQLKSNIQLVCAQGFLNSVDQAEQINLKFEQLPQNIKDGMSRLASDRVRLGKSTNSFKFFSVRKILLSR